MQRLYFLAYLFIAVHSVFGFGPPSNNAASISLGGACATLYNPFAIDNNIAVIPFAKNAIAASAINQFGVSDYTQLSLAGNVKVNNTSIALGYTNMPMATLTTQKIQVGFAKQFAENLSAGVGINYHIYSSVNAYYGKANVFTFNAGLYYQISKDLNVGFSISNPTRSVLIKQTEERLPAQIRMGIDYLISDNVTIYSDVFQVTGQQLQYNGGVQVATDKLKIRGGFGTNQSLAFGLGYEKNKNTIDLAVQYQNQLGMSPALNYIYAF